MSKFKHSDSVREFQRGESRAPVDHTDRDFQGGEGRAAVDHNNHYKKKG